MSQNNPANGGSADSSTTRLAKWWEVALIGAFLIALTLYLLYGITTRWPACELPDEANASAPANVNNQTNVNAGAGQSANANQNANANAGQNADTSQNANANANPTGEAAQQANQNPPAPVLRAVEPASGSIKGGKTVTIRGSGLTSDDVIKFDEVPARPEGTGGGESLTVKTPRHEEGRVDVTIYRGKTLMNRLPGGYTYVCPAPSGTNLFFMLIMAGALGGCIHAMRSLWWYYGNEELKAPWLTMYFVLPFSGAAMAMLFSLLIVAGIVDNTTGRSTSLFIIAIAGLVGMFSQQAALKLTDIANAFFTKPGPGKDAKPQESQSVGEKGAGAGTPAPAITPNFGPQSGGTPVIIANTGFPDVKSITFGGEPATEVKLDSATSAITAVTPEHAPGKVEVVVTNQAGVPLVLSYTYMPEADEQEQGD